MCCFVRALTALELNSNAMLSQVLRISLFRRLFLQYTRKRFYVPKTNISFLFTIHHSNIDMPFRVRIRVRVRFDVVSWASCILNIILFVLRISKRIEIHNNVIRTNFVFYKHFSGNFQVRIVCEEMNKTC